MQTVNRLGRLDILVNNAGMAILKSLAQTTEQEFDQIFALNAKDPYFAMQEAANVIADGGRIANISTGGTHLGVGSGTVYLGTKGGLEQFTKGWPLNWALRASRSTRCRRDLRKRLCSPRHSVRWPRRCPPSNE